MSTAARRQRRWVYRSLTTIASMNDGIPATAHARSVPSAFRLEHHDRPASASATAISRGSTCLLDRRTRAEKESAGRPPLAGGSRNTFREPELGIQPGNALVTLPPRFALLSLPAVEDIVQLPITSFDIRSVVDDVISTADDTIRLPLPSVYWLWYILYTGTMVDIAHLADRPSA